MKILAINSKYLSSQISDIDIEYLNVTRNITKDTDTIISSLKNIEAFVISIDNIAFDSNKSLFYGIELALWLRLKQIEIPIFLLGWLPLDKLLKYNKYSVILSTTQIHYLQLPFLFTESNLAYYIRSKAKQELNQILPYLFDRIRFRHSEANWWSVKLLYDVYNGLTDSKNDYPASVKDKLNETNNYIAQRLYNFNDAELKICIKEYLLIKTSQEELVYANKLIEIKTQIVQNQRLYTFFVNSKNDLETAAKKHREIKQLQVEEESLKSKIKALQTSDENKIAHNSNINKNLLIIDDKINEGWTDAYRLLFPNVSITTLAPDTTYKNDLVGFYKNEVEKTIQGKDLLILDLRLFDEQSIYISPEQVSGVQLLKIIRQQNLDIPVLITSASNKSAMVKTVLQYGADAYWLKQGIDEEKTPTDTIENYSNLINYVEKLSNSQEYTLIKQLFAIYNHCKTKNDKWWENMKWLNNSTTHANTTELLDYLLEIIYLYRFYLQNQIQTDLPYSFKPKHFYTAIINKIGGIVELIHNFDNSKSFEEVNSEFKSERGDTLGRSIIKKRNEASHFNGSTFDLESVRDIVTLLQDYLTQKQYFKDIVLSKYTVTTTFNEFKFIENVNEYTCRILDLPSVNFQGIAITLYHIRNNNPIKIRVNNFNIGKIILDGTHPAIQFVEPANETRIVFHINKCKIVYNRVLFFDDKFYIVTEKIAKKILNGETITAIYSEENKQWQQIPFRLI